MKMCLVCVAVVLSLCTPGQGQGKLQHKYYFIGRLEGRCSYVNRDHVVKEKLEQDRSKAQTTIPVFHHSSISVGRIL